TIQPSLSITSNIAADVFRNVNNSAALSVAPGVNSAGTSSTVNFRSFVNQGLGTMTLGANSQVNVAGFQSYVTLTLAPGTNPGGGLVTQLVNVGTSALGFNTGSRTFISTPAQSGNFAAGIDLKGKNAIVAGGLFVNNGYVVDSSPGGTATVVADYGSLVKGA